MNQVTKDIELLKRNSFIDYSLSAVIVIKPFRDILFLRQMPTLQQEHDERELRNRGQVPTYIESDSEIDQSVVSYSSSGNKIIIGESMTKHPPSVYLREETRNGDKIFHICESLDVDQIKTFEEEYLKVVN